MDRRRFMTIASALGLTGVTAHSIANAASLASSTSGFDPTERNLAQLAQALNSGQTSSLQLVTAYLRRIERFDRGATGFHSVLKLNPAAKSAALALDRERARGVIRGPLHGIPVLIKDNIATADPMPTTAGSLALANSYQKQDAPLIAHLRQAGVVILGKANLSEWANFRSTQSTSGWSGVGGQTGNAYDRLRNPSGSSSGSACAVAASLCAAAIGSETDGSILSPAAKNGIVGFKPSIGLISGQGVIPLSPRQDTAGPMGRCVADVWALAHAMTDKPLGFSAHGSALNAVDLSGLKIGVMPATDYAHPDTRAVRAAALTALKGAGAMLIELNNPDGFKQMGEFEETALLYEFKAAINTYLSQLDPTQVPSRSLADLIEFNQRHQAQEMPFFNQELFEAAEAKGPLTDEAYQQALGKLTALADQNGLAALFNTPVDVLFALGSGPAGLIDHVWGDQAAGDGGAAIASAAAIAGYPSLSIPGTLVRGLPTAFTLVGAKQMDGLLLQIGYAFEQLTHYRVPPTLPT
jgi:amidase